MSLGSQVYKKLTEPVRAVLSKEGLKGKVLRGGAWLGTGSVLEQGSRFARSMILARLLAPEAFGTMAIVLSSSSFIHTVTEIGVKEALIQHPKGGEEQYRAAAWWLAFARSIALYLVFFVSAPFIARFYSNPQLSGLLRVAMLTLIFDGACSSNAYIALKELKFSKIAVMNNGGGIGGVIITVVLSFFIRDVWALVLGGLSESAIRWVFSYIFCPYLPRLIWDREAVAELLHFSKGIFGLSFLNLIFARADIFVLAKLYSPAELGLYVMAIYLVQTPSNYVISLLNQTLLPAFSYVQGENERVNRIFLQVSSVVALLGLPAFVFVFFCGRSVLTLVLGQRYGVATGPLIAAAMVALINTLNVLITLVFYSKGTPQLHRRCVAIMAIIMIVLIYPFAKWFGIVGGQLACLVAVTLGFIFQVARLNALTNLDLPRYGKSLVLSVAISLAAIAICMGTRPFPSLGRPFPNILFGVVGCLFAYTISVLYVFRDGSKVFV